MGSLGWGSGGEGSLFGNKYYVFNDILFIFYLKFL